MENEIYKDIPGYEKLYQVSDLGNPKRVLLYGKPINRPIAKTVDKDGYHRISLIKDGIIKKFLLHRVVLRAFVGASILQTDHKNGNKQDNRLVNLEYVSNRENQHRSNELKGHRSSVLRGVSWHKTTNKWQAELRHNNQRFYLGTYETELQAHSAYNNKLKQIESYGI